MKPWEAKKGRLTTEGNESKRKESKVDVRRRISFQFNPVTGVVNALRTSKLSNFANCSLGNLSYSLGAGNANGGSVNLHGAVDGCG